MIQVRTHTLANGCRVIIRPTPGKPILAILASVAWGARDDAPPSAGMANLMAQLMTKGTRTRSAYEIAETLESVGGEIDCYCHHDAFGLETQTVENDWPVALEILSDCLFQSAFPNDEFEKERDLVIADILKAEDDKFSYAYKHFRRLLYRDHPYGTPSEGEIQTVQTLKRDATVALHRAVVRPDSILLTIVGNVPEAEFLHRIETSWPTHPPNHPAPPLRAIPHTAPGAGRGQRIDLTRDVEQGFVVTGYPAPPIGHPQSAALRLACGVLGEGMSARLFSRLRDRDHLAYAVGASLLGRQLASHLITFIGTGPRTVDPALEGLLRETAGLAHEPPLPDELERAREYILGKYLISRQTNSALAHTMAAAELIGLGWQWAEDFPARMRAVTAQQVLEATRQYLTEPAIAVLRPANPEAQADIDPDADIDIEDETP